MPMLMLDLFASAIGISFGTAVATYSTVKAVRIVGAVAALVSTLNMIFVVSQLFRLAAGGGDS